MASHGGAVRVEIPVDLSKLFTMTYEFQPLKVVIEHIYSQLQAHSEGLGSLGDKVTAIDKSVVKCETETGK
jgi:hypothetical protein